MLVGWSAISQRCAQLTRGHASLGCFTCADCRLRKLAPGADPASATPEARQVAEQTCLLELSTGAEAMGGSYSDYLRLENFLSLLRGYSFQGPMNELVEMTAAARSFESNIEAMNTAKQLMMRTVELLKK